MKSDITENSIKLNSTKMWLDVTNHPIIYILRCKLEAGVKSFIHWFRVGSTEQYNNKKKHIPGRFKIIQDNPR